MGGMIEITGARLRTAASFAMAGMLTRRLGSLANRCRAGRTLQR